MDQIFGENVGGCGSCSRQNGGAKKRKLSAYNIFMKKELAQLKKLYPTKTAPERMKMAAKKWKASPASKTGKTAKAAKAVSKSGRSAKTGSKRSTSK